MNLNIDKHVNPLPQMLKYEIVFKYPLLFTLLRSLIYYLFLMFFIMDLNKYLYLYKNKICTKREHLAYANEDKTHIMPDVFVSRFSIHNSAPPFMINFI